MDNNPSGNRCVKSSPENRTHRMGMYKEKETYFKELAHVIMDAGKSNIFRMD